MKVTTFHVHAMKCGACGYCASAMTDDGKLAAMMLHLIYRAWADLWRARKCLSS